MLWMHYFVGPSGRDPSAQGNALGAFNGRLDRQLIIGLGRTRQHTPAAQELWMDWALYRWSVRRVRKWRPGTAEPGIRCGGPNGHPARWAGLRKPGPLARKSVPGEPFRRPNGP